MRAVESNHDRRLAYHPYDPYWCTEPLTSTCENDMKVFISHAHSDKLLARNVAEALSRSGLEVWSDADVMPGDNWAEEHAEALDSSQAMIVLLSPASLQSQEVRSDISFALGQQPYKDRVIPVVISSYDLLEYGDVPWVLKRMDAVNLDSFDQPEDAFRHIADRIKNSLQPAED